LSVNHVQALNRLTVYARPDDDPTLAPGDVDLLLEANAQTADADGLLPGDEGWTPTYSVIGVYRAAAEAWTTKAGIAAGRFDFTTDGQTFRRSQIVDHCEGMAAHYRRKTNGSAPC
jgi:hypothetical protein